MTHPVRPVRVGVVGTGALGYHHARLLKKIEGAELAGIYDLNPARAAQVAQELDTVARLGLKFLYVVVNDEAYGAEYHKLRAHERDPMLSFVRSPDFAGLGRDFGCRGASARTLDEFSTAIDEFLAGDGPMVIDLRISRNVVSIPYRRLHFGMDV